MSVRSFGIALVVTTATGCADRDGSSWAGTIRDSAGVVIVENPLEGTWLPGHGWTLREEVSIGEGTTDPNYQFGRVVALDVDAAGNVYVADQQGRALRVYAGSGTFLRTIGAPGSGPGEFGAAITGLEVVGEQLFVTDVGNRRVSRFALSGDLLGDTPIDVATAIPIRWDEAPAGRAVAQVRPMPSTDPDAGHRSDAIVAVRQDGAFGDTVGTLPAGETITTTEGRTAVRLFQAEPVWDAAADGLLVSGRTSHLMLEVRRADSSLERVVRRRLPSAPVTESDKAVILDAIRERAREQSRGAPAEAIEAYLRTIQFADRYPALAALVFGPGGSIWAQRVRSGEEMVGPGGTFDIGDIGAPSWDVFDAAGRYLGVIELPGRFRLLRVVGDRLFGVALDDLDVQTVKVYRVITG